MLVADVILEHFAHDFMVLQGLGQEQVHCETPVSVAFLERTQECYLTWTYEGAAVVEHKSELCELYRSHIVCTRREGDHWVSHYGLPDHSTPDYPIPNPYPHTRAGGGFLRGPYEARAAALEAAKRAVDKNITEPPPDFEPSFDREFPAKD